MKIFNSRFQTNHRTRTEFFELSSGSTGILRRLLELSGALLLGLFSGTRPGSVDACSTLLVGRQASSDGSVLMASSCDGDVMGLIDVMPARLYPPGTMVPMYWNVPRPKNYDEYQANVRQGYDLVGELSVTQTHRSLIMGGNLESMTTGGLNEHGLSIAIEFLPMRLGLACERGVVGPNSNHWTTSLIANGVMRAKTAREAITLIGEMVERYGFLYYRAPQSGVALPIADKHETWLMEIFGPGADWTPGCGKPGGVWCAQRIPDGEVGCTANRSRIGEIDLGDTDHFMASPNVHALAQELGFWGPGTTFVWSEVYGGPGTRASSMREWRALSLMAPSLDLKVTGDPEIDRYPFSVQPDTKVEVETLITVMRDAYEGTAFDLTQHPAFQLEDGTKSVLARPTGPSELFEMLRIQPERALSTPSSGYVFVAQLRDGLPDSIAHCLWFAYGPAQTSCFLPIYAGVTALPEQWSQPADFTRIDRHEPQWNFRLVHNLTSQLRYQDAIRDVREVIQPAENRFREFQPILERVAMAIEQDHGPGAASQFLNEFTRRTMNGVGVTYRDLADYLTFKYLVGEPEFAKQDLPQISPPALPVDSFSREPQRAPERESDFSGE